jgi:manganese transport protein
MVATRVDELRAVVRPGEAILRGERRFRLLPFLGPAFVACVAYIDPGNFATNIAGGSKFGYTLVWVIVASNLMAMLIQTLSAKLGIATGRNLPEICREQFSRRTSIGLWIQAEAIAMATDLAEFLGAAIGFHLLFGIGLFPAAVITGATTFGILSLQRFGFRPLEAVITGFVAVISLCYVAELWFAHPPLGTVAKHAVVPQFDGNESLLLAVGILGATVMPHVIYLHSALLQNRIVPRTDEEARRLYRFTRIDVVIAMTLAGVINMAMLVVAASVFFKSGLLHVDSLESAHRTLAPLLGSASSKFFALALIASGMSSGDDAPRVRRDRDRRRSIQDAHPEPGRPLVRDSLRADPTRDVHAPPRRYGKPGQPPRHDCNRRRGRDVDLGPERLPACTDVRHRRLSTLRRERLLLRISKRMSRLSTTPAALP